MKRTILFLIILIFSNVISAQEITLVHSKINDYQNVRDFCISKDEVFFTIQSPNQELSQIVCVTNNRWEQPVLLSFNDNYSYLEPFLSQDGKRLYFASNRPKNNADLAKNDFDIWYVERTKLKDSWSTPINLGSTVNSDADEFYPTLAHNGNLYFTMDSKNGMGKDDIYYCQWNGNYYSKPILLNENINSDGYEFNAFISGDEQFLIYSKYNTKDGYGSGDLYLSKKDANGLWKPAENMGNKINTKYMEYCPFYDSKTQTLYFTSKRNKLVPQKYKNIKYYLEIITGSENGLSKIYQYKITL